MMFCILNFIKRILNSTSLIFRVNLLSVIEFNGQWYFFYHDGSYPLNGTPGGHCRRHVRVEYLYFNPNGSIKPIVLTTEGVNVKPKE